MNRRYFLRMDSLLRVFYLLIISCFALYPSSVKSKTWYVSAGSSSGDGSQQRPFPLIQMGVDLAQAGDTVLVSQGTYYETVRTRYSGEENSGEIRYIYILAAGNGPAVVKAQENFGFLINPAHDYIWVEGFSITRGYGTTTPHGSGIRTFADYGVFIYNQIYDNDVGIFSEGTGEFAEETNNRGNYIAFNIISDSGEAAVRIKHSSENDVVFNLFYHNAFRIEPAGIVTFYCGVGNRVINNTFWDNGGPAVEAYNGSNSDSCIASAYSDVRDNIFVRLDAGLLLMVQEKTANEGSSTFAYNLFWGPDSSAPLVSWGTNEYHEGGYLLTLPQFITFADTINPENGKGTLFADPQFADVGNLNFDLLTTSPAVNAGSRLAIEAPFFYTPDSLLASSLTAIVTQALDADIVDLGYHHEPGVFYANPTLDADFGIDPFPNPYSGNGSFQFTLPNVSYPRRIKGTIYNLMGRQVLEVTIPDNAFNQFRVHWVAGDLASGAYFLILDVDGAVTRDRILLLK